MEQLSLPHTYFASDLIICGFEKNAKAKVELSLPITTVRPAIKLKNLGSSWGSIKSSSSPKSTSSAGKKDLTKIRDEMRIFDCHQDWGNWLTGFFLLYCCCCYCSTLLRTVSNCGGMSFFAICSDINWTFPSYYI